MEKVDGKFDKGDVIEFRKRIVFALDSFNKICIKTVSSPELIILSRPLASTFVMYSELCYLMHGVFFDLNDFCKKYVDDYGIVGYDMQRSEEDVNISIAFGMEDIYDDDYYEKSYKKGVLSVSEVDETCDNVMVDLNNEEKLVRDVEEASDSFDGPMMKDEDLLGVVEIILAEWRLCSGDMKCILAERAEYVPYEVLSHFKDLGAMIYKVTDCIGTVEGARSSGVPIGEDVDSAHAKGYDEGYDDCMSDHNLK